MMNSQERGGSTVSVNIELVQSTQAWNALRDQWDNLLADSVSPSIFLSFDYLSTAYKFFHSVDSEPFILIVKNADGTLIGIMPFRRSTRRYWGFSQAVLEYLVTWEIDKPYVIVRDGWDETVWAGLFEFLDENPGEWDLLELTEMSDALAGARVVEQLFRSQKYRYHLSKGPDGPCVDLTQSWEQFLEKHKKYRTALNRLAQLEPDYRVRAYNCPDNIEKGLAHYLALERLSWKHGRVGVVKNNQHTEFYRSIVPALADKGRCSIHVLLSGEGREIAGIISYSFEKTLYVHHTVYDPEFSSYSPGKLLMGLVLKEHMGNQGLVTADLLCGFADYYKPWAARIIATSNVKVLRLSPVSRLQLAGQWIKGII
jgi:CelD/BcsL family acetyltransferase involved in cellulose biosynthesis